MNMWNMFAVELDLEGDDVLERYGWVLYDTTTYTSPGGYVTWKASTREDGFRFDAFAFALVEDRSLITSAILDGGPPPPPDKAWAPDPHNGETNIGMPTGVNVDVLLKWRTALDQYWDPNPNITSHMLYYAPNDPDLDGPSVISVNIPSGYPSVAYEANWLATSLVSGQLYHWRVDEICGGDPCIVGNVWNFTTIPTMWIIVQPDDVLAEESEVVQFEFDGVSATPPHYQWKKSDDLHVSVNDANVGTDSNTLTVIANDVNEAFYYCIITAEGSEVSETSDFAGLWLKKEVARYKLNNNLTDDTGNGWTAEWDQALDPCLPHQTFDTCSLEGTHSVLFHNDPNAFISVPGSESYFSHYVVGMTVNCWIKTADTGGASTIASKHALSTTGSDTYSDDLWQGWMLTTQGGNAVFEIRPNDNVYLTSDTAVADNDWHMVTATYDYYSETPEVRIYIDGDLAGIDNTVSVDDIVKTPFDRFAIGSADANDGHPNVRPFDGQIDDVRIWTYPLTSQDIAGLYFVEYGNYHNKEYICIDGNHPEYDFDGDCDVDFADFALFAATWLECEKYPVSTCGN
jgi:hypothetical protein